MSYVRVVLKRCTGFDCVFTFFLLAACSGAARRAYVAPIKAFTLFGDFTYGFCLNTATIFANLRKFCFNATCLACANVLLRGFLACGQKRLIILKPTNCSQTLLLLRKDRFLDKITNKLRSWGVQGLRACKVFCGMWFVAM